MLSRRRYTGSASTARSTRCARPTPPAGRSPAAGTGKAALLGIQSDEYGGGRPDLVHAEVFAGTVRAMGLDDRPQAHPDRVPAAILLLFDVMNLFGLHRRLRGTIVGHLAAFEMTSSIPPDTIRRRSPAPVTAPTPPGTSTSTSAGHNGKVDAVLTAIPHFVGSCVVIADDDVRYSAETLLHLNDLLQEVGLVRPQNHPVINPSAPSPCHVRWDTARALVNRAWASDYPGHPGSAVGVPGRWLRPGSVHCES